MRWSAVCQRTIVKLGDTISAKFMPQIIIDFFFVQNRSIQLVYWRGACDSIKAYRTDKTDFI